MTEVNISSFDNEISILYKWGRHFKVPIRLILVDTVIEGDKERNIYRNGISIIQNLVQEKKSLQEVYQEVGNKLEIEDIAMIYSLYIMSQPYQIDRLLTEINQLFTEHKLQTVSDETELQLVLTDWRNNLRTELTNDLEDLQNLEIIHAELAKYPEVLYSPIEVDQVTLKSAPLLKTGGPIGSPTGSPAGGPTGNIPTLDDGVIIFNESKLSYDVPYIKYNSLHKLYRGRTDEEMPNYKMIIPSTSQINTPNTFFFTVWNGKGTLDKATKESYMKGSYSLKDNRLNIKIPVDIQGDSQKEIIQKIEKALPVSINNITETAISGEFFLFDLDLNDIYLVHMVINTELMSSYLFVKETNTPYAEKKQLKIYYKSFTGFVQEEERVAEGYIVNPSSVAVSLTQNTAHGGEIVTVMQPNGPTKFRLNSGTPYVRGKITQAESLETANQFIRIFSRLMQYYKAQKAEVERYYSTFIPELLQVGERPIQITVKQSTGKKGAGDSKIERLKEVAPDLFVKGYARRCQCVFQPIAVPTDEIQAWQQHTFLYKDVPRERQIMPFPPNDPKWYFVCPNDSVPFPGVKLNKDLSNKEVYPCVPCCFKDDQMDPTVNSTYNECFLGRPKKAEGKVTKETHKIKTDKILSPGRYGFLPKGVADLLSKYSNKAVDMVRMGVVQSVNSLLHCISLAVQDPSYLNLSNDDKEKYVRNIRNVIVRQTQPNLLKQEMFDFSSEEILEQLSDPQTFFDPNLFYRAVENAYNINIYVFAPPDRDETSSLGSFEIPRFKLFHSRSPRPEKRAVLIFRTQGAESDSLEYPQCELIVDRDEANSKNVYNFGQEMNTLLNDALVTLNRTITWELVSGIPNVETTGNKEIVARENIYSLENYFYLLNKAPTKQIIDGYGKTRAFIMPITATAPETGDQELGDMTVIIPSSQPENLPTGSITRVAINTVIEVFGEPKAVSKSGGKVDGLWYQILDIEYGLYVPVLLSDDHSDKPVGPANPLLEEGQEVVPRIRKLKRDLETIIQIVIWLFILSKLSVGEFVTKYMSIGNEPVDDSSTVYDFSKVGMKLPVVKTVEEGIEQMKLLAPSLFKYENRIFLYSQKFYEGILYNLQKYNNERKPRNPKIPSVLYRSNISEEDFTAQRRVAIFTSDSNMKTWLNSLDKLSFRNILVEDSLNISHALRTEPYLYNSPTGNIYLIQNVVTGSKLRAINVALNWYVNKINLGHRAVEFEDPTKIPVFVVYGISPALAPVLIENHAGTATQYLQILSYGSDQYAAMLTLL